MKKIVFKIITPTGVIHDSNPISVTVDTLDGQLTILPNHTPILVPIKAGEIVIRNNQNEEISLAVHSGFLEVLRGSVVNALVDEAVHESDIDEKKVNEAIDRAQKLKEQKLDKSSVEYAKVATRLEHELAKLRIINKKKRR